jgi:hypothetical protein
MKKILFLLVIIFASAGCKSKEKIDPKITKLGRATGPVKKPHQNVDRLNTPPAEKAGTLYKGTIIETIDVKNYTYINFKTADNKELWAAVIKGKFTPGQKISIEQSIIMKNFNSPTLRKSFRSIIFGSVKNDGDSPSLSPALPPGHPPVNKN